MNRFLCDFRLDEVSARNVAFAIPPPVLRPLVRHFYVKLIDLNHPVWLTEWVSRKQPPLKLNTQPDLTGHAMRFKDDFER